MRSAASGNPDDRIAPGAINSRLFRDAAADVMGALLGRYGARHLEAVEDAFQEAMVRAVELWPFAGVPERPRAWLYVVARNRLIDGLRREQRRTRREREFFLEVPAVGEPLFAPEDRLRLIVFCCHPALSARGRVALTLQLAGGFRTTQIARALLARPPAVEKLIQRAKQKLRVVGAASLLPDGPQCAPRLRDVLRCVYLIFNEGLNAHAGQRAFSEALCAEALRLTLASLQSGVFRGAPLRDGQALAALICFQAARLPARLNRRPPASAGGRGGESGAPLNAGGESRSDADADVRSPVGEVVLLQDQNRALWDRELIARGFAWLRKAGEGERRSRYHLEAGIAACHALAPTFAATDWHRIARLYGQLLELQGGPAGAPVTALNRAVALLYAEGPTAAQAALDELEGAPGTARILRDYHLLPATRAAVCMELGRSREAREYNQRALKLARLEPERRLLRARLTDARRRD